jgi:hypothetical protein
MPQPLFALGIFQIGSLIYSWASRPELKSYLCFQHSWDDRCKLPCPAFTDWDGGLKNFLPWADLRPVFPISTLQSGFLKISINIKKKTFIKYTTLNQGTIEIIKR